MTVLRRLLAALASLKLTIACLLAGMVLVLLATFAQKDAGIFYIQKQYFQTFFIWWTPSGTGMRLPVFFGGYSLGGVLVLNLFAAHVRRFVYSWQRLGLWLTHAGVLLLIAGMFVTAVLAVESRLELDLGQTRNYSEDSRHVELVAINVSHPDYDEVVSFPPSVFGHVGLISDPRLPFKLKLHRYFANSDLSERPPMVATEPPLATAGTGAHLLARPLPVSWSDDAMNAATLVVEPCTGAAAQTGPTYALSNALLLPEEIVWQGETWRLALRAKRYYTSYSVTLREFHHDIYPGTDIPRNFSSKVTLNYPAGQAGRDELIFMNHPLRTGGKTYYQSQFRNEDRTSILQVVENPGWTIPYIACLMVAAGLLLHFLLRLTSFLRARQRRTG